MNIRILRIAELLDNCAKSRLICYPATWLQPLQGLLLVVGWTSCAARVSTHGRIVKQDVV